MILQTLPTWVTDIFEPFLWWVAVVVFITLGIYFFSRLKHVAAGQKFILGLGLFAFLFGIARLLENIRKYSLALSRQDIFEGWIGMGPIIAGPNFIIRITYYVLSWVGIALFFYYTEKYVFKQRYIFTTSAVLEGIVSSMLYFGFSDPVMHVLIVLATAGFFIAGVAPPVMYLIMAAKSTGSLRLRALMAAIGITLFVLAVMTDLPEAQYVVYLTGFPPLNQWLISVMAPVFISTGTIIMGFAYRAMFKDLTF